MKRQVLRYNGHQDIAFADINATFKTSFLNEKDVDNTLQHLQEIPWTRVTYPMYGKTRVTPRQTWCFGRLGQETVSYRGKSFLTEQFPEWLQQIARMVHETTGFEANAVILNKYESGEDHINWHADDEKFLDEKTVASLSFGQSREFGMRSDRIIHKVVLQHNSFLLMKDGIEHCLPSTKTPITTRWNITLRKVATEKGMGNYYYYNRGI
jgi:alkylated DNA repair dioxygenase AlkB